MVVFLIVLGMAMAFAWGLGFGYALRHDRRETKFIRDLEAWRKKERV